MPSPQPSESAWVWFKSSYSGGNTTECVECAHTPTGTHVRDSKRPEGPALALRANAWQDFVDSIAAGRLTPLPPAP
ncbi:DUF397 domain-containing protein [Streptomyces sp. NPDC059352]|uniref:DUF397 domain-containing protein n=1 Tax=Streptomyces sp. NPDC059352 TaxID=3346810 RepID=UPI0036B5F103